MKASTFKLLDAINREGLDNGSWGLVQNVEDTKAYFNTVDSVELPGQWLYIYRDFDDVMSFIDGAKVKPDYMMVINGFNHSSYLVHLYKL